MELAALAARVVLQLCAAEKLPPGAASYQVMPRRNRSVPGPRAILRPTAFVPHLLCRCGMLRSMPKRPNTHILPPAGGSVLPPPRRRESVYGHVDAVSLAIIEEMARVGLSAIDILRCLGWDADDLRRHEDKLPELDAAMQRGRSRSKFDVMTRLYTMAMEGDFKAIRLFLAVQDGWSMRHPKPPTEFRIDLGTFARGDASKPTEAAGLEHDKLREWQEAIEAARA